eukprot:13327407-Alexandrium_andersonii.AAC.1
MGLWRCPRPSRAPRYRPMGGPVDIKLVQAVDMESSRATPRFAEGGEAKRATLRDVAAALQRALRAHFGRMS